MNLSGSSYASPIIHLAEQEAPPTEKLRGKAFLRSTLLYFDLLKWDARRTEEIFRRALCSPASPWRQLCVICKTELGVRKCHFGGRSKKLRNKGKPCTLVNTKKTAKPRPEVWTFIDEKPFGRAQGQGNRVERKRSVKVHVLHMATIPVFIKWRTSDTAQPF